MSDRSSLLSELYQARLEDLKEIASAYGLAKNGSVEFLRAQLIRDLILSDWDLTIDGLRAILNSDLGIGKPVSELIESDRRNSNNFMIGQNSPEKSSTLKSKLELQKELI